MGNLFTDPFSRALAQIAVTIAVGLLMLTCLMVDYFILMQAGDFLSSDLSSAGVTFFYILALPYDQLATQLTAVFASMVPVFLSSACYEKPSPAAQPDPSSQLNAVGKSAVIMMIVGVLAGSLALILISADPDWIGAFTKGVGDSDSSQAAIGAISTISSFLAIYLAQLLGLKPK